VHFEATKQHRGEWEIRTLTLRRPSGETIDLSAVSQRALTT
jgi:hypothetical protein